FCCRYVMILYTLFSMPWIPCILSLSPNTPLFPTPFGSEAAERTRELIQDAEKIEVEFDAGPAQDYYGRYLVYVYADGEMINEILVREGLAEVTYVNPPNDTHADLLYVAQARAQSEDLSIWSETN